MFFKKYQKVGLHDRSHDRSTMGTRSKTLIETGSFIMYNYKMQKKSSLEKINAVLELLDYAEHCVKSKVLKRSPGADKSEIERELTEWYQTRPGAEHGDFSGAYTVKKSF